MKCVALLIASLIGGAALAKRQLRSPLFFSNGGQDDVLNDDEVLTALHRWENGDDDYTAAAPTQQVASTAPTYARTEHLNNLNY